MPSLTSKRPPRAMGRGEGWALLAALLVLVLYRAVYLAEYARELPFAWSPVGDSLVYLQQAVDVRLGRHPSPSLIALSPLYGYFLAFWASASLLTPLVVQAVLGVALVALTYLVVRARFGPAAAVVSGALLSLYGVTYYFESKLLSETLGLALTFVSVAAYTSVPVRDAKASATVACGAAAGLAVLARASLIFSLPLFVLCAALPWVPTGEAWRTRLRRSAWVALGIGLVLGGNGLLNLQRSGRFVPVIMVSRTLESASGARYGGRLETVSSAARGASPFDAVRQAAATLERGNAESEGPGVLERVASLDYAALIVHAPGKLLRTFDNRESNHQYGYLGERATLATLGALPVTFGLLMLWGLAGAVALVRSRGGAALWPYAPVVLGCLVTSVLYHPSTRYRLGMIVPALLLAGLGARELWAVRDRRAGQLALALGAALSAAAVVHGYSLGPGNRAEWELQIASSHGLAGNPQHAALHARRALALAPHDRSVRRRAEPMIALGAQAAEGQSPRSSTD